MSKTLDEIKRQYREHRALKESESKAIIDNAFKAFQYNIQRQERIKNEELREEADNINLLDRELSSINNDIDVMKNAYYQMNLTAPEFVTSGGKKLAEISITELYKDSGELEVFTDERKNYHTKLEKQLLKLSKQADYVIDNYDKFAGDNEVLQQHEFNKLLENVRNSNDPDILELFKGLDGEVNTSGAEGFWRKTYKSDAKSRARQNTSILQAELATDTEEIYSLIQGILKPDYNNNNEEIYGIADMQERLSINVQTPDGIVKENATETQIKKLMKLATSVSPELFMQNLVAMDRDGALRELLANSDATFTNWNLFTENIEKTSNLDLELEASSHNKLIEDFMVEVKDYTDDKSIFSLFERHSKGLPEEVIEAMWVKMAETYPGGDIAMNDAWTKLMTSKENTIEFDSIRDPADIRASKIKYQKNKVNFPLTDIYQKYNTPELIWEALELVQPNMSTEHPPDDWGSATTLTNLLSRNNLFIEPIAVSTTGAISGGILAAEKLFGSGQREYRPNYSLATAFTAEGGAFDSIGDMFSEFNIHKGLDPHLGVDNVYYETFNKEIGDLRDTKIGIEDPLGPNFMHSFFRSPDKAYDLMDLKKRYPDEVGSYIKTASIPAYDAQMKVFNNILNEGLDNPNKRSNAYWGLAQFLKDTELHRNLWSGIDKRNITETIKVGFDTSDNIYEFENKELYNAILDDKMVKLNTMTGDFTIINVTKAARGRDDDVIINDPDAAKGYMNWFYKGQ